MVHPSVDIVTEALKAATSADKPKESAKKEEVKKAEEPKAASLLQSGEAIVLQVNGTPILVNPESQIKTNTEAAVNLGVHISMGFDDDIAFS